VQSAETQQLADEVGCAGGRHNMSHHCKLTFDLLTLKVVFKSRDVGYLCANFGLPRPLCSRLSPGVRDWQTADVRRASSFNAPYPRGGDI